MKRRFFFISFFVFCLALSMMAANKKTTVPKVSEPVTLTEDVDYQITSTTPFDDEGLVNIENTEHAVLILTQVKPSDAISKWLDRVQINGVKASNNINCQVKLYNRGCIIMPYGRNYKPLTVFAEQNVAIAVVLLLPTKTSKWLPCLLSWTKRLPRTASSSGTIQANSSWRPEEATILCAQP